jgi:hypothetical protein
MIYHKSESSPPDTKRPSTPESPTYRDIPVAAMLQEQR